MLKRSLSLFISLLLIISCSIITIANTTIPTTLDVPKNASVRIENGSSFYFRWTNPQSIIDLNKEVNNVALHDLTYHIDWKRNDGAWNIATSYDDPNYNEELHHDQFFGYMGNTTYDEKGVSETFFTTFHLDPTGVINYFDLKNDTYYFRIRYRHKAYDNEFPTLYSSYSPVIAIGKNASNTTVTKLDAPQNLKVIVKYNSQGKPYFQLNSSIPDSVTVANTILPVSHVIDFKIGTGKWLSETTSWDWMPASTLASSDTFDPVEKELVDAVIIEENTYFFRILYQCVIPNGGALIRSPYSNIASTRVDAYSEASNWAKPELDKAANYNLIPTSLIGSDMTKSITREEFAEVALKLYEVTTGINASPISPNPFPDTNNPEILKAFNLGIVAGYSDGRFGSKDLINREQVASMLTRAIKKMVPTADFSITGAPSFNDVKHISGWALNDVKYITKQGIILGSNGNFMPRATTTIEIAAGYANTTREQAILMSVRTYEKFKQN